MKLHRAGIVYNQSKPAACEVARELKKVLEQHDCEVVATFSNSDAESIPDCDFLSVIGGDGTILQALDYALERDLPILSINLGRMGFLTEVEPEHLREDINEVFQGNYRIEGRSLLSVASEFELSQTIVPHYALNDVVITRSTPAAHILSMEIDVDGTCVERISGDGVIIATSTGSTAYSLSAGGPIVRPGLGCFVITPVCPHTMYARPVVVSSDDSITVRVLDDRGGVNAVFDGRKTMPIPQGNPGITVSRAPVEARFIRIHNRNYFSLLQNKLSDWTH